MSNFKKAWQEIKKGAPRELGIFLFILVLALCAATMALPVIWLMNQLPDWTWWIWGAAWIVWMLFGDTIGRAYNAFKGKDE